MAGDNRAKVEQFPERMMPKMLEYDNVRQAMPEMMSIFMPHCLAGILPHMDETKREEFTAKLTGIINDFENLPQSA